MLSHPSPPKRFIQGCTNPNVNTSSSKTMCTLLSSPIITHTSCNPFRIHCIYVQFLVGLLYCIIQNRGFWILNKHPNFCFKGMALKLSNHIYHLVPVYFDKNWENWQVTDLADLLPFFRQCPLSTFKTPHIHYGGEYSIRKCLTCSWLIDGTHNTLYVYTERNIICTSAMVLWRGPHQHIYFTLMI